MKTISTLFAVMLVAASALATGVSGLNSPQSGVFVYTNGGSLSATNTFNPVFTDTPIITAFASATNAGVMTNITVTASNLVITTLGSGSTNYSVAWSAQYGTPLIQCGSFTVTGGTPSTNTFNTPYGVLTCMSVDPVSTTNVSFTSTTSGFIVTSAPTQKINWISIGRVITPGSNPITAP